MIVGVFITVRPDLFRFGEKTRRGFTVPWTFAEGNSIFISNAFPRLSLRAVELGARRNYCTGLSATNLAQYSFIEVLVGICCTS